MENVNISGGEIEIERFPTRNIEARVKDLVPAVDYPQSSNFEKLRCMLFLYMQCVILALKVSYVVWVAEQFPNCNIFHILKHVLTFGFLPANFMLPFSLND
jgi:hypothetical protein